MQSYTLELLGSGEIAEDKFANDQQAYEWVAWVLDRRGYDASELVSNDWDADGPNDDGEQCYHMLYWANDHDAANHSGAKAIAQLCKVVNNTQRRTTMTVITIDTQDIDSVAQAIKDGITTPELMAEHLGVELIDGCLVLDDVIYASDGNWELGYVEVNHYYAAQNYVDDVEWDSTTTEWVDVSTYRKGINKDGKIELCDKHFRTIAIEPEEPECVDDDGHDWQSPWEIVGGDKRNPGVFGHGGGVKIYEACLKCGCRKITDTWAQHNGEQGLRSVEYTKDHYLDEVAKLSD